MSRSQHVRKWSNRLKGLENKYYPPSHDEFLKERDNRRSLGNHLENQALWNPKARTMYMLHSISIIIPISTTGRADGLAGCGGVELAC